MSQQEKRSIFFLISTIITSAIYILIVFLKYDIGSLTDDYKFWAIVILIYIPIQIVTRIIIYIIFAIIIKVVDNEDVSEINDEMDKLIELKSTKNSFSVFGIGFLLSMASLVIEMPPTVMLNILLFTMFASGIISDVSAIYFYRKGV